MVALLSTALVFGQTNPVESNFKKVVSIDSDTLLSDQKKLNALYKINETFGNGNDSDYIITCIKLAKYEWILHNDKNLAIRYSLNAMQANALLKKPVSHNILVNCYYNLAAYYNLLLQQTKAIAYYDTVILLCKQFDPDNYLLESMYRKSSLYSALGDYQKQIDDCTSGIYEATNQNDSLYLISFLNLRAEALTYINDFDKAFTDLEKAILLEEKTGNQYWLANSYQDKAIIYKNQKQNQKAEFYFKKALEVRPRLPTFYERIAIDYNELGRFYLNNVKDFKRAEENYLKTLAYANKCTPSVRRLYLLIAYENLGDLYYKCNKTSKTLDCYKKAFEQINFKSSNFLFNNPSLNNLGVIEYNDPIFVLLNNKTELLLQLYKKTKKSEYLDACLKTALLTDSFVTRTRHQNIEEKSKLYWRNESRDFFNNAIEACYLLKDVKSAFYFIEKSRAVLLNDKWNELNANIHLPKEVAEKQQYLETKIIQQNQKISFDADVSNEREAENNLHLTEDSFQHFIKFIEKKYPTYYQSKYADNVFPLPQLQQYLAKSNQSFVYYYMTDTLLYALGITKNKTDFKKIPVTDFDCRLLSDFIRMCSNKKDQMNHYAAYVSLSHIIYKKIFQPLHIPKGNVAICTDNFFIPFEALCSDDKGKNYLLYDYNVSYVYSARALLKTFTHSPPAGNFIGFAPVSFSSALGVFDLKQSASALQNVADFYSSNTLFTQQQATRSNFINEASRYSVVTVFSHAQADTTGTEPVLYMQDSLVHLSDLQRLMNPSVQFVLLSACQTNIGKNETGEGIYSLARGFASAGIPSVSATLWKADEGAVYQISIKFNEYLSKGFNKAEALQKAKMWYLQNNSDNENGLPFYWANMVLIGSSQPVTLLSTHRSVSLWMAGIGFLILLLLTGYYFYYKKKKVH